MRYAKWGRIRHPSCRGEMLFWIGLALCGAGAGAPPQVAAGALAMIALFLFVSIPLKEARMRARRDGWDAHAEAVAKLIPGVY